MVHGWWSTCLMLLIVVGLGANPGRCQVNEETLSGSDRGEHAPEKQQHLFGDWGGERASLLEKGIRTDLLYASDTLWNVRSAKQQRVTSWNRARGTIDIDFSRLTKTPGLRLHVTAVWQGGSDLGKYLGLISEPSGLTSHNACRLDSWWLEKHFQNEHLVLRLGQFAAQDTYGAQLYGNSFIFEPFQYAIGNLGVTYESSDPPSTPAAEVRIVPIPHVYVKSMGFAADRLAYAHNPTGLIPQFRGALSVASEIGFTSGADASALRPQDTVETRKQYFAVYQLGAVFNPGKFTSSLSASPVSGNYIIYGYANHALYRTAPQTDRGIDITAGADWSPADRSRNNQDLTIGARFNEPFPTPIHNTIGVAYVRSGINRGFPIVAPTTSTHSAEHAFEVSVLFDLPHAVVLQPVLQYYINSGGGSHNAVILGLHTRIDF